MEISLRNKVLDYINNYQGQKLHDTEIKKATNAEIGEIKSLVLDLFNSSHGEDMELSRSGSYDYGNGWIEFEIQPIDNSRVIRYRNIAIISLLVGFLSTAFIGRYSSLLIILPISVIIAIAFFIKAIRLYSDLEKHEKPIASFFILNALFL